MSRTVLVGAAAFAAGALAAFGVGAWLGKGPPTTRDLAVEVSVDFGPAGKPPLRRTVRVPEGATVLDATRAAAAVKTGLACCDPLDVDAIDGVASDPENEGWWLYDYNDHKGPVSAYRLKVAEGDRIAWRYVRRGNLKRAPEPAYREGPVREAGQVKGRVAFTGSIPDLPPFPLHKNVEICAAHPGETHKPHPCRPAGTGSRLQGAVVWLSGVVSGKGWGDFPERQTLDQKSCVFLPHLVVARRGSKLELKNSDPVLHTVHAYDESQTTVFNMAQAGESSAGVVTLDRAGVLDVICDAGHRWMKAHVVVLENPYYAVTDAEGVFRIDLVPPGTYKLNVWHDLFGKRVRTVEVREGEPAAVDVAFEAREFRVDLRYAK